uniref:Uncharacterized protein n=1 Tax=Arundo donax TaxID=35708 RepID=A0A0A9FXF2_ARUDO
MPLSSTKESCFLFESNGPGASMSPIIKIHKKPAILISNGCGF